MTADHEARCECPERAYPADFVEVPVYPEGDPRRRLPIQQTVRHVRWCPVALALISEGGPA